LDLCQFGRRYTCGLDLEVNVALSVYAHGWFLDDYESENCEIVGLDGLDTVLEELYELKSPNEEEENLEEWTTSPGGCAVFIEGKDDKFIFGEFLARKAGEPLRDLGVHIFGGLQGGGRERAVSSTNRKGKEALERLLIDFGVRPTAQVKQLIARNLKQVPQDFDRLMKKVMERIPG
jgi:hypothetical protein